MSAAVRLLIALLLAAPAAAGGPLESAAGAFRLTYHSDLEPLVINRMHGWVLELETADGEPVEGAELTVEGGMPAHDHGLPTRPRVTEDLRGGRYRLEGLRFHMNGAWELVIRIDADGRRDRVVILLTL